MQTSHDKHSLINHNHILFADMLWRAPELLKNLNASPRGSQKGDVYSYE